MKQETIGSKGTVPGYRPLIGAERWCNGNFNLGSLIGGFRPYLASESKNGNWGVTRSPLPPPAVETFEAHGHIWYKHTPGGECPVEPDAVVDVLWSKQMSHSCHLTGTYAAKYQNWSEAADGESVIGYRFPDYPAVHIDWQQEQHFVQPQQPDQLKQQLASIYNGWVHLPPETVAECIADVASVLYPTDAERCEAAFQRWFGNAAGYTADKPILKTAYFAAWKAAKESK